MATSPFQVMEICNRKAEEEDQLIERKVLFIREKLDRMLINKWCKKNHLEKIRIYFWRIVGDYPSTREYFPQGAEGSICCIYGYNPERGSKYFTGEILKDILEEYREAGQEVVVKKNFFGRYFEFTKRDDIDYLEEERNICSKESVETNKKELKEINRFDVLGI